MSKDASALTKWVEQHPAVWGVVSATAIFAWSLMLFDGAHWLSWAVASALFGLLNYWLWRKSGPGHRLRAYLLRRFPKR